MLVQPSKKVHGREQRRCSHCCCCCYGLLSVLPLLCRWGWLAVVERQSFIYHRLSSGGEGHLEEEPVCLCRTFVLREGGPRGNVFFLHLYGTRRHNFSCYVILYVLGVASSSALLCDSSIIVACATAHDHGTKARHVACGARGA